MMALLHAGQPVSGDSFASTIASATLTFAPLSAVQRSILQQRGNPDVFSMLWVPELSQKREAWLYLSSTLLCPD